MSTTRVLLIGAGGHARVCLEALHDQSGVTVVGAVSSDGATIAGLGVVSLGTDADLADVAAEHRIDAAHPAIGSNRARASVGRRWAATGLTLHSAISRFAMLSSTCELANGVAVLPGAVVNAATRVGAGTILNTNSSIDHDCVIGEYVHIAPGVAIGGGVTVEDGALIGIGARVLPNLTIGAGAVVGGGSVVVSDVPAGATVVGCPARPAR